MLTCDGCNTGLKVFQCYIEVKKMEKRKRTIVKIPFEVCDLCLTKLCKNLGNLKASGQLVELKKEVQQLCAK